MAKKQHVSADDVNMLARTIYGEARGENYDGKVGVANVVVNRFLTAQQLPGLRSQFGGSLQGTMLAGGGDQFNCWRPSDANYTKMLNATNNDPHFVESRQIAYGILTGQINDNTKGSDHYYNPRTASPDWGDDGAQKGKIGNHKFSKHYGVSLERNFATHIDMGSNPIPGMAPVPFTRPWHLSEDFQMPRPRPNNSVKHDDIGNGALWDDVLDLTDPKIASIDAGAEWGEIEAMTTMSDVGHNIQWEDITELTTAQAFKQNFVEMTLNRGDTIAKLAAQQGIARSDIATYIEQFEDMNDGVDANRVGAGKTYKMPVFQKPANSSSVPMDLQNGSLSKVFNPTEPSITLAPQAYTHTVERGQSLTHIADRLFPGNDDRDDLLKAQEIAQANGIKNVNMIRPGDMLTIPGMAPEMH